MNYKNSHRTTVATLSSTKTQINKTQQRNLDNRCSSFRSGSGKTGKVLKKRKMTKGFSFRKQIFSCCVFIHQYSPVKSLTNPSRGCHL